MEASRTPLSRLVAVRADLDRPSLEVTGSNGKPYFQGHGIELAGQEHVEMTVTFTGRKHAYRWLMEVDYVLPDGGNRTAYVDATGKLYAKTSQIPQQDDFSLTGRAPRYGAVWEATGQRPGFHLLPP